MILFFSEHCQYCRMLLETIKRHDANKTIKLVSIESLKASGHAVPAKIHSVPALMLLGPSREFMFGKAVFDYLLLPGTGRLLVPKGPSGPTGRPAGTASSGSTATDELNLMAFSINHIGRSADNFASLSEDDNDGASGLSDRGYNWTSIQDIASVPDAQNNITAEETRSKKGLPDLDAFRAQRDVDLGR
jgi:hypothetical protein